MTLKHKATDALVDAGIHVPAPRAAAATRFLELYFSLSSPFPGFRGEAERLRLFLLFFAYFRQAPLERYLIGKLTRCA